MSKITAKKIRTIVDEFAQINITTRKGWWDLQNNIDTSIKSHFRTASITEDKLREKLHGMTLDHETAIKVLEEKNAAYRDEVEDCIATLQKITSAMVNWKDTGDSSHINDNDSSMRLSYVTSLVRRIEKNDEMITALIRNQYYGETK
jgi:hypothetical protein